MASALIQLELQLPVCTSTMGLGGGPTRFLMQLRFVRICNPNREQNKSIYHLYGSKSLYSNWKLENLVKAKFTLCWSLAVSEIPQIRPQFNEVTELYCHHATYELKDR